MVSMTLMRHVACEGFGGRVARVLLVLVATQGGCAVPGSSLGEVPDPADSSGGESGADGNVTDTGPASDSESASGAVSAGAGSDDAADSGSGEDGTVQPLGCPPHSDCTFAMDCDTSQCGGIVSPLDASGCARPSCTETPDCPAGYTCAFPYDWGNCGVHGCGEFTEPGTCECGFGLDCNNDGICVPEDEYPPPTMTGADFCRSFAGEQECADQVFNEGRCHWLEGYQVVGDMTCEDALPASVCAFSNSAGSGTAVPLPCPAAPAVFPFYIVDAGITTVVLGERGDSPLEVWNSSSPDTERTWLSCLEDSAPPECDCACP